MRELMLGERLPPAASGASVEFAALLPISGLGTDGLLENLSLAVTGTIYSLDAVEFFPYSPVKGTRFTSEVLAAHPGYVLVHVKGIVSGRNL